MDGTRRGETSIASEQPDMTEEEALQQARAEGLTLLKAKNKAGYFGVHRNKAGYPKPYQAGVRNGGKLVYLGVFATAAEAALCIARSPEGQAAEAAAAPRQPTSETMGPECLRAKVQQCSTPTLTLTLTLTLP